ncbi:EamA family transporter [bacterium]|nr:EamA family transporter [bacterium]
MNTATITKEHQTPKLVLAFIAIYFVWGSTYLAIRYAVESIPPLLMMGTRSLIAGLIIIAWSWMRGDEKPKAEHLPALFIIGASFFLVGHGLLAWAEQTVPSGLAALLVASEPAWIALIESLVARSYTLSLKGIAGLIVGFVGIVLLVAPTGDFGTGNTDVIGAMAIIVGALSWSGGAVYSRFAKLPSSPMMTAGFEIIIGGVLLLLTGIVFGEMGELHAVSLRSLLALLYLIIFGSVIAFSAYVWLLSQISATKISTHTYVNPVIAVLLGWILADEPVTFLTLAAAAAIMLSIYLVFSDRTHTEKELAGN